MQTNCDNPLNDYKKTFIEDIELHNKCLNDKISSIMNQECNLLKEKYVLEINELRNKISDYVSKIRNVNENNSILEKEITELRENLVVKNRTIIELETEKQNWNKVSYTKFLDKQVQDKKKDLEVMGLRFNNLSKQNNDLRSKNKDLKMKIKELCENNNIELDEEEVSLSDSIIDHSNTDMNDQSILMEIKSINEENEEVKESEELDNKINIKIQEEEQDDSSTKSTVDDYSEFQYTNKSGNTKKYLQKKISEKIYLFTYTEDLEKIGDAVGELRSKNGNLKPSFYRKKKS